MARQRCGSRRDGAASIADDLRARRAAADSDDPRLRLGYGDLGAALELMAASPIDTAAREDLDAPREALAALRRLREDPTNANPPALTEIAMWAAYFGDSEFALEIMKDLVAANKQRAYLFWYPQMRDARRLPGFKAIMREAGFVDYWNEFGWPDTCRRATGDDFECD